MATDAQLLAIVFGVVCIIAQSVLSPMVVTWHSLYACDKDDVGGMEDNDTGSPLQVFMDVLAVICYKQKIQ